MTARERFLAVLNGKPCDDRLPMVEWVPWWHVTIERWEGEGLPAGMDYAQSLQYFGLDELHWPDAGEINIRFCLDGFFWFPRKLLGIEPHLYAFYEEPKLMHTINNDLVIFTMHALEALFAVLMPEFERLLPVMRSGRFKEIKRPLC